MQNREGAKEQARHPDPGKLSFMRFFLLIFLGLFAWGEGGGLEKVFAKFCALLCVLLRVNMYNAGVLYA